MDYEHFLEKCYNRYKYDWCKQRGYNLEEIDEEVGINGECYVCLEEFEQNEFQDQEYVKSLLTPGEFELWEEATQKNTLYENKPKKNSMFILDDDLYFGQDEARETVDGYLWAMDALVERMKNVVKDNHSPETVETFDNINFYPIYNLRSCTIKIEGTYYYNDGSGEQQGEFEIPLSEDEQTELIDAMESYCKKKYNKSCTEELNTFRKEEGLEAISTLADKSAKEQVILPQKKDELLSLMREEYINNGYLYSGSWPYNSLLNKGFSRETINKLLDEGLMQKRNCEGLAYELKALERKSLIAKHDLCSVWYEKAGDALLPEIKSEAQFAAAIPGDKSGITVSTLKNEGDLNKPDKMTVYSPFSVGQVIQLEYDLPKKMSYSGYSLAGYRPGGVAIGSFIVTDIIHNLLVFPRMNMIELQSLDHTFNKVHPDARTMLIFENVVLKRLKEPSLEDKIQSAEAQTTASTQKKEITFEH